MICCYSFVNIHTFPYHCGSDEKKMKKENCIQHENQNENQNVWWLTLYCARLLTEHGIYAKRSNGHGRDGKERKNQNTKEMLKMRQTRVSLKCL